jgi:hypothetical protein
MGGGRARGVPWFPPKSALGSQGGSGARGAGPSRIHPCRGCERKIAMPPVMGREKPPPLQSAASEVTMSTMRFAAPRAISEAHEAGSVSTSLSLHGAGRPLPRMGSAFRNVGRRIVQRKVLAGLSLLIRVHRMPLRIPARSMRRALKRLRVLRGGLTTQPVVSWWLRSVLLICRAKSPPIQTLLHSFEASFFETLIRVDAPRGPSQAHQVASERDKPFARAQGARFVPLRSLSRRRESTHGHSELAR